MPPSTTDIVLEMRSSPLYGRNALFTRMVNGISGIITTAQESPKITSESIRAKCPNNQVASVLAGLYADDNGFFDSIDKEGGVDRAVTVMISRISESVKSVKSNPKAPGELDNIGILFALSKLVDDPELSDILAPISGKLKKIAMIASSKRFAGHLRLLDSVMAGWGNVKTELTNVRETLVSTDVPDNTVNAPSANRNAPSGTANKSTERSANPSREQAGTPHAQIIAIILEGARRGGVEAAKSLPNDKAPVITQEAVARLVAASIAPSYSSKQQESGAETDRSLLIRFRYDIPY
jgi:hypothetical protein